MPFPAVPESLYGSFSNQLFKDCPVLEVLAAATVVLEASSEAEVPSGAFAQAARDRIRRNRDACSNNRQSSRLSTRKEASLCNLLKAMSTNANSEVGENVQSMDGRLTQREKE